MLLISHFDNKLIGRIKIESAINIYVYILYRQIESSMKEYWSLPDVVLQRCSPAMLYTSFATDENYSRMKAYDCM